jgi:hypothetical protein
MVLNTAASISLSQINSSFYFKNGNVGVDTTDPASTVDIAGTLRVSTSATISNIIGTNISTGTLRALGLSALGNVTATNITTGTMTVSGLSALANVTATNVTATNISSSTLTATTITGANLSLSENLIVASTISGNVFTGSSLQISGNTSTGTLVASTIVLGNNGVQNTTGNVNINFKLQDASRATTATTSNLQFYQNSMLIESSNLNTFALFHQPGRSIHYGSDITIKSGDVIDGGNNGDGVVDLYGGNVIIQAGIGNPIGRFGGSGSTNTRGYNGKISFKVGEGILNSSSYVTTEVMAILAGGNVGIGTSTPSYKLDVNGAGRFDSLLATTSISSASLSATNVIGSVISAGTLIGTTITGANLSLSGNLMIGGTLTSVNITTNNLTDTNISAGLLNASSITTASLLATTSISSASVNATNSTITNIVATVISTSNLASTTATIPNIVNTNISASTLNLSIGITTVSAQITNENVTTSTIGTARITSSLLALGNSNTVGNIFTTGGNVGVGTIEPQSTLDIVNNNPILHIRDGAFQKGKIYFGNSSHGVGRGANISTLTDVNDVLLWTNGGSVGFATESNERMRITNAGNVGIGTNSPSYKLDVNGTSRVSSSLTIGTGNTANFAHQTITSNLNFPMAFCANSGNFGSFIFGNASMSTSYVSINSIISGYMLDVDGSGRFTGALAATNNSNTVGNIFTTAGNVGIGLTLPSYNLDVNGTSRVRNDFGITANNSTWDNTLTKGLYMRYSTNNGQDSGFIQSVDRTTSILYPLAFEARQFTFTANGFERMVIASTGNVGIGTTSPSGMLHLNNVALFTSTGNLTCTGDVVSFGSLSDRRLKKNIQTIETLKALDIVSKLRAVKFDWRDDIFNEQKRNTSDIGFIAQEIEEIIPEAVSEYTQIESGEVYKNIKHERIIPYLLTAIQYLLQEREN